jgi:hypothetical protein
MCLKFKTFKFVDLFQKMCIELLSKDDYNIISVDWMMGATPPYSQAVANARLVGAIIADFLKSIQVYNHRY